MYNNQRTCEVGEKDKITRIYNYVHTYAVFTTSIAQLRPIVNHDILSWKYHSAAACSPLMETEKITKSVSTCGKLSYAHLPLQCLTVSPYSANHL